MNRALAQFARFKPGTILETPRGRGRVITTYPSRSWRHRLPTEVLVELEDGSGRVSFYADRVKTLR